MRVAIVVGNPKPLSRTRTVAEELAGLIAPGWEQFTVDLCDYGDRIFKWPDLEMAAVTDSVAGCDLAIFASPTYKAAYSGLLKAFLDRYPQRGLVGMFAIPLMTISDPAHALAPEFTLRPVLVELGAVVPTSGLAFQMIAFGDRFRALSEWVDLNSHGLATMRPRNGDASELEA